MILSSSNSVRQQFHFLTSKKYNLFSKSNAQKGMMLLLLIANLFASHLVVGLREFRSYSNRTLFVFFSPF